MASYRDSVDFDPGTLGFNLATFDEKVGSYISRLAREEADLGERDMKDEAPWTRTGLRNRWGRVSTGHARSGLWAHGSGDSDGVTITMGHTASYGIFLEKAMGERFAIVEPILERTGVSFMRSLEAMFSQMEANAEATPAVVPGEGHVDYDPHGVIGYATSGETGRRVAIEHYAGREVHRGAGGRFVSRKATLIPGTRDTTKRTKRTRRK